MIVPMKKATIITRREQRQEGLLHLRRLGVLHISSIPLQVPSAQEWREKKTLLEKALAAIPSVGGQEGKSGGYRFDAAVEAAHSAVDKVETLRILDEEYEALKREAERLQEWEGISLQDLQPLEEEGYKIRFYEIPPKQIELLPSGLSTFVVKRSKTLLWIAVITKEDPAFEADFKPLKPPQRGLEEIEAQKEKNRTSRTGLYQELERLGLQRENIRKAAFSADREIELAEAASAMGHTEALSYLSGFLPSDQVPELKKACGENSWALLIQDPSGEDEVPTVVRNKRWIDIIRPVFELLGTVPGYRENDISLIFLLFFTFFFAAIIGDGGYGLVMFTGSLYFTFKLRRKGKATPAILTLMLVMSFATILWGALTGTWFGSVTLASLPFLSWMTVPALSSFNPASGETFKYVFFVVGTLHISIAHIWNFIHQLKEKPMIRSFTQLGWLFLVLGLYYLVLNLVLSSEKYPMPRHAMWLMVTGLTFIILFSQQSGRFFHGVAMGFANLLTTFLSSISAFSDIISYIRLFAVGLATIEISKSFNTMASGLAEGTLGIVLASIVLLLGHTLNLAMGALSVVVHGVRLNMLEFSGHLGMEWTGRPYKPFKE